MAIAMLRFTRKAREGFKDEKMQQKLQVFVTFDFEVQFNHQKCEISIFVFFPKNTFYLPIN